LAKPVENLLFVRLAGKIQRKEKTETKRIRYQEKKDKTMAKKQIFLALLVCLSAVFMQGCAVALVGAGAGTVAYLKGSLEAVVDEEIGDVFDATVKALKELKIPTTKTQEDALAAIVVGRTVEDKKITIKLKATENNMTKLSIKIGMFGDRAQSQLIYDKIKKRL